MIEMGITRLSSKGQIVLPIEMRHGFKEGEKMVVMRRGEQIILQKATMKDEKMAEDIEFARRTEEAYQAHLRGEGTRMSSEDFMEMMKDIGRKKWPDIDFDKVKW